MMDLRCPGSKYVRQPIPEIFTCSNCGAEVEIWTNELKRKCRSCGQTVARKIGTTYCIQWCQCAKECIGIEMYEELLRTGAISEDEEGKVYIPKRLKEFMKESGIPIPNDRSDDGAEVRDGE
jgi:DNA-directed RNA polymerase subunit RPC12/RpoP